LHILQQEKKYEKFVDKGDKILQKVYITAEKTVLSFLSDLFYLCYTSYRKVRRFQRVGYGDIQNFEM